MNTRSKIVAELKDKAYRDAFVRSQINVGIPFQVRALRKKRKMSQKELAEKAGMLQPRVAAIERPGGGKLNLETLLRLASAFDVGLTVKFAPFSEVTNWAESFNPESFDIPSFACDFGMREGVEIVGQSSYSPSPAVQTSSATWVSGIPLERITYSFKTCKLAISPTNLREIFSKPALEQKNKEIQDLLIPTQYPWQTLVASNNVVIEERSY